MKTLKTNTAILAAVLSLSVYTELASAHCYNGLSLASNSGTAPVAADLYRVQCYKAAVADGSDGGAETTADTNKLIAQLNRNTGTGAVTVQIGREGFSPSSKATDTSNSGTNIDLATCTAPSLGPQAQLNPVAQGAANGNGDYNILVTKSNTAASTYGIVFHCQDATTPVALHTGTREVIAGSAAPELAGNVAVSPDIDLLIDN